MLLLVLFNDFLYTLLFSEVTREYMFLVMLMQDEKIIDKILSFDKIIVKKCNILLIYMYKLNVYN